MTRTDLNAFFDTVLLIADAYDGWSEILIALMVGVDGMQANLADELSALHSTLDDDNTISEQAARECGFTHRDLLRLLEAGILSEVTEVGDGFRVRFAGLDTLALGMVA